MTAGRTAVMALALLLGPVTACAQVPQADQTTADQASANQTAADQTPVVTAGGELAHPAVSGAAGPFARTVVTLTRPSGEPAAPFAGTLDVGGGKQFALAGPDEPRDFFLIEARAVLFTPIEPGSPANGIVILYNSSRIGPGHGTDRRALVYRVTADAATRVPEIEALLEGAADAATARRRLAGTPR